MPPSPRILTIDPTSDVQRMVRAVIDLSERQVIQVDVPGSAEALEEVASGRYQMVVTALTLSDDGSMDGFALAQSVQQASPGTAVIVIADEEGPESPASEVQAAAPFVYFRRPLEPERFSRVLIAGLDGLDVATAYEPPLLHVPLSDGDGFIPPLDVKATTRLCDRLLTDVGALAVIISTRAGVILLERSVVSTIDRGALSAALVPSTTTAIEMNRLIGGKVSVMQVFDGAQFDIYTLSVGFHYVMTLVFDGEAGIRQIGSVNRYGRRAAEDLITLIGPDAFVLERPKTSTSEMRKRKRATGEITAIRTEESDEHIEPVAVKAEMWEEEAQPPAPPEPEPLALEPIADLDVSILDDAEQANDEANLDDLFDPSKLAKLANEARRERGPLSYEEARELGIIP
ncbi:response regulator [Anaerolineae bacterium CFX9]|nr:response regulator [Anaerolineae bacterium CFX9]